MLSNNECIYINSLNKLDKFTLEMSFDIDDIIFIINFYNTESIITTDNIFLISMLYYVKDVSSILKLKMWDDLL